MCLMMSSNIKLNGDWRRPAGQTQSLETSGYMCIFSLASFFSPVYFQHLRAFGLLSRGFSQSSFAASPPPVYANRKPPHRLPPTEMGNAINLFRVSWPTGEVKMGLPGWVECAAMPVVSLHVVFIQPVSTCPCAMGSLLRHRGSQSASLAFLLNSVFMWWWHTPLIPEAGL